MALSVDQFQALYERLSHGYDRKARLFSMIGFDEVRQKRQAVAELRLRPGDTVVDIGCGTGVNFELLLEEVGESGRIIGVDLTQGMLAQAGARIRENGWNNVELVQSDAAEYAFPPDVDAVLSTYALTFVPGFASVIESALIALGSGQRFAVLDMKKSQKWPGWVVNLMLKSVSGFGITHDLSERKPWEVMEKHAASVTMTEYFGGFAYLAIAQKGAEKGRDPTM
ncbi:MAG: methyltransferase domain-containing protein [Alphaproteobacteria bacterium]|nr:methyltransferase domain-containing protein [Alphaproteobacteria bacterium]